EKFYFYAAMICFAIAAVCILMLSLFLRNFSIIGFYALILFLVFSYSHKPLAFSYHRLGELIIFVLFGPALVMGGYFIQTQIFPDLRSFMLSLPFGFFTTAILYSNEIPDFQDDRRMGKYTWVGILGKERSYIIYCLLIFLGFLCIGLNIILGYLGVLSLIALVFIAPSFKAVNIIKTFYNQKEKLIESSRITIIIQSLVSLILVLDIIR
ncbi:MAG: prenyltransferase, partial [Candidatus Omnitrophota bacterium]